VHKRIIEDAIERKKIEFIKNSTNFPFLYNMLFTLSRTAESTKKRKTFCRKGKLFLLFTHFYEDIKPWVRNEYIVFILFIQQLILIAHTKWQLIENKYGQQLAVIGNWESMAIVGLFSGRVRIRISAISLEIFVSFQTFVWLSSSDFFYESRKQISSQESVRHLDLLYKQVV